MREAPSFIPPAQRGERGGDLESLVMQSLGLEAFDAATQTYPRKQDWLVLNALAGLAMSLHKFAFDLRVLQSPPIGEWAEPFGSKQVGSSAMPFKRNPVNAEKIDSLARYLAQLPRVAWDNAANSLLERTLDDSANRRIILPEAFLCADELLITAQRLIGGLVINEAAVSRNFAAYAPFAATERLLMAAGQSRRGSPGDARSDPRALAASLGRGRCRSPQPVDRCPVRRRTHHSLSRSSSDSVVVGCARLRRRCASTRQGDRGKNSNAQV